MLAATKTSALIVTASRVLTKDQRACIAANIASQLPASVGVVVLDAGFTALLVGDTPAPVDMVAGELASDEAPSLILAELQKLGAAATAAFAQFGRVAEGNASIVASK